MQSQIEPFHYRIAKPGYSVFPGAHPGQAVASGQLFKRHEPLLASPDPRRIDLRASVLDPFNHYRVRVFQQHSPLTVYLLADLSASMGYQGQQDKRQVIADFVSGTALAAQQVGDPLGFIGCAEAIARQWIVPAGPAAGRFQILAQQLRQARLQGSAQALLKVAPLLPARRSLVFLLSDFHFELTQLARLMQSLSRHAVVPLVLWDAAECIDLPEWGLIRLQDSESRAGRLLWMRPKLKEKIQQAFTDRQASLRQQFRAFGAEPLFFSQGYQAERLTRYFQQRPL